MKKAINIILILVVLSLWGTALYRFLINFFIKDNVAVSAEYKKTEVDVFVINRDTFLFTPLEKDPFLNAIAQRKSEPQQRVSYSRLKVMKAVKKDVLWPRLSYYGFIKSNQNSSLALLKINSKLYKVHEKEIVQDMILKAIYKDSIKILYEKQFRTIKREGIK